MSDELFLEPVRVEVVDGLLVETFEAEVPWDLYEGDDADVRRADYAIYTVREYASVFRLPAAYEATPTEAETITVVRRSRAREAR